MKFIGSKPQRSRNIGSKFAPLPVAPLARRAGCALAAVAIVVKLVFLSSIQTAILPPFYAFLTRYSPMKKRLFLLLAGIAMATTSFAQTPTPTVQTTPPPGGLQQTPEQLVERRAQYLAQQLGLSPDQQAKLRPLLLAQREQM